MSYFVKLTNLGFRKAFFILFIFVICAYILMQKHSDSLQSLHENRQSLVNLILNIANKVTVIKTGAKLKYIVYECSDRCGGWADRLKGDILKTYLIFKKNKIFESSRFE